MKPIRPYRFLRRHQVICLLHLYRPKCMCACVRVYYCQYKFQAFMSLRVGRVALSVQRLTMGWSSGIESRWGTRFPAIQTGPGDPPSLLYNGYWIFPEGRGCRGVGLTPHPHLVPKVLEKSRALPLLTLRTCVAYKKGESLHISLPALYSQIFRYLQNLKANWYIAKRSQSLCYV